jgi:hypothetical protein
MDLELRFGSHVVGVIEGAFWSDGTGYGMFRPPGETTDASALRRVREYIAFSEDWHERLGAESGYDRAEWDAFRDVYASELWHTVSPDGTSCRISGPVFIRGEVTWGGDQPPAPDGLT